MLPKTSVYILGICLWAGVWTPAWSQVQQSGRTFLVVDHDRLMAESTAAEKVRKDIEKKRQSFQDELAGHEQGLRQEAEDLKRDQSTLSEDAFTQKRLAFEKKVSKVHEKVADRRAQLEQAIQDARVAIIEKISDIVEKVCQERSVDAVMPKAGLVYSRDALEVTTEVLSRLNAQLPEVKINFKKTKQEQDPTKVQAQTPILNQNKDQTPLQAQG